MKWIKIDPENLPEGEVFAANFAKGTYAYKYKYLGYLSYYNGMVVCDSTDGYLENCTHYIDIHNHDIAE